MSTRDLLEIVSLLNKPSDTGTLPENPQDWFRELCERNELMRERLGPRIAQDYRRAAFLTALTWRNGRSLRSRSPELYPFAAFDHYSQTTVILAHSARPIRPRTMPYAGLQHFVGLLLQRPLSMTKILPEVRDSRITQYFLNDQTITIGPTNTDNHFHNKERVKTLGFSLPYNALDEESRRYASLILSAVREQTRTLAQKL